MVQMKFELTYYDAIVQDISHHATAAPLLKELR